jgi:hypothetical protein
VRGLCPLGLWPSADAPGAAGEEQGAGDLLTGLQRCLDGGLIGLEGGLDREPFGIEECLVLDGDGGGAGAAQLVIGEREARGCRLQPGEHQDQRFLQGIGPGGVGAGQLCEPLGLLLAVGGLAAQVLDHPAGGISLGGEGLLVALFGQQGSFQLSKGLGTGVVVIGFQLLSELTDGGGELLGLDAQLPEGTGPLQGAGRAGGLRESRGERSGGGGENGHGL